MKVIGIKRQQGTYEGRAYDNYKLYCQYDNNRNDGSTVICGYCPDVTLKVKSTVMAECIDLNSVANLLGHDLDFYYDSYKNVCKVVINS